MLCKNDLYKEVLSMSFSNVLLIYKKLKYEKKCYELICTYVCFMLALLVYKKQKYEKQHYEMICAYYNCRKVSKKIIAHVNCNAYMTHFVYLWSAFYGILAHPILFFAWNVFKNL